MALLFSGRICPRLSVFTWRHISTAPIVDVHSGGDHLHATAGTIFHKSSTSLHLCFYAKHLLTSTPCGISTKQLERELGVTSKTASRMAHLIRTKLGARWRPIPVGSQMDETDVGARNRGASRKR
jgi:transposase